VEDNETFEKRQTEVGFSISEAKLSGIVRKKSPAHKLPGAQ